MSKEDERSAALARRAQEGDYDEGEGVSLLTTFTGGLTDDVSLRSHS